MHQYLSKLNFKTRGIGLEDITGEIKDVVSKSQVHTGMVNLTIMHTSASLIIQENASPDVQRDILIFLDRLIPMGKNLYEHRFEGIDDMPAHLKAMITNTTSPNRLCMVPEHRFASVPNALLSRFCGFS